MADVLSKKERSFRMALVKSSGNKSTEKRLLTAMRLGGIIGWRRNYKLPGRPDFVFPRQKLVIFVDGCFWHGCPRCYRRPRSNQMYWDGKVVRNRVRDRKVTRELRRAGWTVLRLWECELKKPEKIATFVTETTMRLSGRLTSKP